MTPDDDYTPETDDPADWGPPLPDRPTLPLAPIRVCCGQRHPGNGPICPDGKVMCQLCFGRFRLRDLHPCPDEEGMWEDVCQSCWEDDQAGRPSRRLAELADELAALDAEHPPPPAAPLRPGELF